MRTSDPRHDGPADGAAPSTDELALDIRGLTKVYGQGSAAKTVLGGIDLEVRPGHLVCVVGPSGAGKTTLLRCMSGLTAPTDGTVHVKGTLVTAPPPSLAVVFQDYTRSLFPWLRVAANVEFPLIDKKVPPQERKELVAQMLAAVGLSEHAHKYPRQLSGGMQQRVAIARALAYRPSLLLMDEPFAALDAQTRADLEDVVLRLRDDFGVTIVFVTHDIDEAVYLGDRVAVLSMAPARVQEVVEVDLPAPRDQVTTKAHPHFAEGRTRVLELVRRAQQEALGQDTSRSESDAEHFEHRRGGPPRVLGTSMGTEVGRTGPAHEERHPGPE